MPPESPAKELSNQGSNFAFSTLVVSESCSAPGTFKFQLVSVSYFNLKNKNYWLKWIIYNIQFVSVCIDCPKAACRTSLLLLCSCHIAPYWKGLAKKSIDLLPGDAVHFLAGFWQVLAGFSRLNPGFLNCKNWYAHDPKEYPPVTQWWLIVAVLHPPNMQSCACWRAFGHFPGGCWKAPIKALAVLLCAISNCSLCSCPVASTTKDNLRKSKSACIPLQCARSSGSRVLSGVYLFWQIQFPAVLFGNSSFPRFCLATPVSRGFVWQLRFPAVLFGNLRFPWSVSANSLSRGF